MEYFGSDYHLGHRNIIKYSNRPFDNIEEMAHAIISRNNEVVKETDLLYMLGDIYLGNGYGLAREILSQMNGIKHWIIGNHDSKKLIKNLSDCFVWHKHYERLTIRKQTIILCHYPLFSWEKMQYNSWMLHGHSHGNIKDVEIKIGDKTFNFYDNKIIDVGIDTNNYYPYSFDDLYGILKPRTLSPVDHHSREEREEE